MGTTSDSKMPKAGEAMWHNITSNVVPGCYRFLKKKRNNYLYCYYIDNI